MTDKKNNFDKDINVPCKEQIIIDGVNVSKCKFAIIDRKEGIYLGTKCLISKSNKPYNICECNSNCYFKRRARKTQECEQKDERIIELTRAYKTLKQECNTIKEKNKGLKGR